MTTNPPSYPQVRLKHGRDKAARNRHPWVFSGAIERIEGEPAPGAAVDVVTSRGDFIARGLFNPASQIAVRLHAWDPSEHLDDAYWRRALACAIAARCDPGGDDPWLPTGGRRLVNAESDGLPGLVVDAYGEWVVLQALTLGIDVRKAAIVAALVDVLAAAGRAPAGIYERSDVDVRAKEALAPTVGVRYGEAPPDRVVIDEPGPADQALRFEVDVRAGHKTGFYLDQRLNRRRVAAWCRGRTVLNVFSYTGGFAVQALAAGARRVVNVDTSEAVLDGARRNLEANGLACEPADLVEADGFSHLRRCRALGESFDAVILDPPKLAASAGQVERAARAYKDANRVALQILRPGGILATFSCSGRVSADLFQKIVFAAAVDAGRDPQIVARLGQPPDHPVRLGFPEGEYLTGLICRDTPPVAGAGG
ncbi:23S rRNA (cytosine(1962)-C(5))-methyltransferase RlmI [bacterium]|nr:class I SAM-dependent rRNA methyltransferase [Chloroflexi bacterium CFX6]RIL12161.1 MAG: 23S rRNA (cytosine(1962)-C(5))-methyltransferase RlmI [bacterium]